MTRPVRIPSDVNRPDRVVGPFTARQAAILAGTGAVLYLPWTVVGSLVAAPLFLAGAVPVAAAAVVIALGHRDGLSMDRLLVAAIRHRLTPAPDQLHDRTRPEPNGRLLCRRPSRCRTGSAPAPPPTTATTPATAGRRVAGGDRPGFPPARSPPCPVGGARAGSGWSISARTGWS